MLSLWWSAAFDQLRVVSIHPRHFTRLPTVVFHPRRRHDIKTTAAVFCLSSSVEVPPPLLSTIGKRAFPVAGANTWNELPFHVTSSQSLAVFRQRLKTPLFSFLPGHPDMSYRTYHYLLLSLFLLLFFFWHFL